MAAIAMVGRGKEEEARRRGGKSARRARTLRRRWWGRGGDMELGLERGGRRRRRERMGCVDHVGVRKEKGRASEEGEGEGRNEV
jgi:hypothetical protein